MKLSNSCFYSSTAALRIEHAVFLSVMYYLQIRVIYHSFRCNTEITNSKIPSHRATSSFSDKISSRCILKYLSRYPSHSFHVESEISLKEGIIGWMQTLCLPVEESALIGYRSVDLFPVVIFGVDDFDHLISVISVREERSTVNPRR